MTKVTGIVELKSKEAEFNAPQGFQYIRLKGSDIEYVTPILLGAKLKIGKSATLIYKERGKAGPTVTDVEASTSELAKPTFSDELDPDYPQILAKCQMCINEGKKSAEQIVRSRWNMGKTLVTVKPQYGEATFQKLSEDLKPKIGKSLLYEIRDFAAKTNEKQLEEIFHSMENVGWYKAIGKAIPSEKRSVTPTEPRALPSNLAATPQEMVRVFETGPREGPPTKDTSGEMLFREALEMHGIWNFITQEPISYKDAQGLPRSKVPDFLYNNVIIEVDDPAFHPEGNDDERDKTLEKLGFPTVRFTVNEVKVIHRYEKTLRDIQSGAYSPVAKAKKVNA